MEEMESSRTEVMGRLAAMIIRGRVERDAWYANVVRNVVRNVENVARSVGLTPADKLRLRERCQLMTGDQIYDIAMLITKDQIDDLATLMTGDQIDELATLTR